MEITDKSHFPSMADLLMPILKTYYEINNNILTSELSKMVHEKYYSDCSLSVTIKSGRPLIYDRISISNYCLYVGKYIERVGSGNYKISQKGIDFIKSGKELTYKYLTSEDEDYINSTWHKGNKSADGNGKNNDGINNQQSSVSQNMTPQEMLDYAFKQIETPKKDELLQRCREIDPFIFEKIVGNLCEAMGYGTFIETPKSRDGGIDGIIKGDSLGFEKIFIQAKRYADGNCVQEKEMQNFVGALAANGVKRGIFFTTSKFADKAIEKAKNAVRSGQDIVLVDGDMLMELMFKYEVGVQTRTVYKVKDIDEDFFDSFS